jgi:hypothetical protein
MAALSIRDRLLTRRGARAILSPIGLIGGAGAAALAAWAGLPLWAAVPAGAGVWAVNGWRLLPRAPRPERIDPFTLHDPWRRFVQEALQARARFGQAVDRAPPGPLRERLAAIGDRVHTGVEQSWLIARRAEALVTARRGIDVAGVERRLTEITDTPASDPAQARVAEALGAQRATAARLDAIVAQAETELRVLDARLDEAVARTIELSAHATTGVDGGGVSGLSSDVDEVVTEMESLRQALEETAAAAGGAGASPGGGPLGRGEPPPGGPG